MKNDYAKTRKVEDPYWTMTYGDWTWKILKLWQAPDKSVTNPFARAFCAVTSPYTAPGYDMGDTYVRDVPGLIEVLRTIKEEKP